MTSPAQTQLATTFGRFLRAARESRGWTQAEVAERVGMAVEAYGRLERGGVLPRAQTLVALARALETSCDALLGLVPADRRRHGLAEYGVASEGTRPAGESGESPQLRLLVLRLRSARPSTIRFLTKLLAALERR